MSAKVRVLTVFGTRPEAIKMCPLVKELEANEAVESLVCATAQHRQMLDQVLGIFGVKPDFDLNVMTERQTLESITIAVLNGLSDVLEQVEPDLVLVHGDTTTAVAASMAAFYHRVSIGHVEAGLRTYNKYFPFPEEANRQIIDRIADLMFAPTALNESNLAGEHVMGRELVTGNTVIDAFRYTVRPDYHFKDPALAQVDFDDKRVVLMTAHRRENLGKPLENICHAVLRVVEQHPDVVLVYPVHLNPAVRETVMPLLGGHERIVLTDPVDVEDMHNAMSRSYLVLTDSGGLQEEAPHFGKPVVVLRENTERPEAVDAGTVVIGGTSEQGVFDIANRLLVDDALYSRMARAVNPYGDGHASERIVEAILENVPLTRS